MAVFLTLAATSAANAQTAAGHVFTAAPATSFSNPNIVAATVDLSEPLLEIIADARADFSATPGPLASFSFGWALLDRGDNFGSTTPIDDGTRTGNDGMSLIVFQPQGEMQAGDLVRYDQPSLPFIPYAFTIRIYNNGGVLYAADEVRAADSATPANSDNGEFYLLTTDWTIAPTRCPKMFSAMKSRIVRKDSLFRKTA